MSIPRYIYDASIPTTEHNAPKAKQGFFHELWRFMSSPLVYMNETIPVPRWLVIACLPTVLTILIAMFGFMWSVSNSIARIDQRGIDQDKEIKESLNKGKLTEEHQRQLEKDFAEFNGWQRGRAGEQYRPPAPRRDDRNDDPRNQ